MKRVLVPMAAGFEEIEAVTIIDVLRRADVEVVVAGVVGAGMVRGSHGIMVQVETSLAAAAHGSFDLVLLPGGEPGSTELAQSELVRRVLERQSQAGRLLGAICAAPRVLAAAGLLTNRRATSHPSVERALREAGVHYEASRVVRDGSILTSRGPGTALEFALAALELLGLQEAANRLRTGMLVDSR